MDPAPRPEHRPGLLAALVLTFAGMSMAMLVVLAGLCLYAGAPLLCVYCVAGLVAASAASVAVWTRVSARRRRARWVLAACALWVVLIVLPWPRATSAEALVQDRTLPGYGGGRPWFGGIPEDELVRLGSWAMATRREREQAVRPGCFDRHYAQVATGGVVPSLASRVLDSWVFDRGHYWLAAPKGEGPFPLLVFLHGNAGPFHFYPQALAQAAVEAGYVVAFPSWGFGYWDRPEGYARVEAVVDAVQAEWPIDGRRVVVGGLSAGGFGAVGAFVRAPQRFRGCLVISGVPPADDAPAEPFVGRPLLLIHGARDQRVDVEPARDLAQRVTAAGGAPRYVEYPEAGHFLLLTHEPEVVASVRAWLAGVAPAGD